MNVSPRSLLIAALCLGPLVACADAPEIDQDETAEYVPAYAGDDGSALSSGEVSQAITVNVDGGDRLRCTTAVNFRATPSPDGRLIRVLPEGSIVVKTDHADTANGIHGYYKVTSGKDTGWVWGPSLLDISDSLLRWGLHPNASAALRAVGVSSGAIMQTIGNAPASAGTHLTDGYVNGAPYSAAVDLSVQGLSTAEIHARLDALALAGYAGWYRRPCSDGWPCSGTPHIHANYTDAHMKGILQAQVRDWLAGRNGLASHTAYRFHTWSAAAKAVIQRNFESTN